MSALIEDWGRVEWSAGFSLVLFCTLGNWGRAGPLWFSTLRQVELNRANAFTFPVLIFHLAVGGLL